MKKNSNSIVKKVFVTLAAAALITAEGFSQSKAVSDAQQAIFPKGKQGPTSNFTGQAFNYGLVESDSTYNTVVEMSFLNPAPDRIGINTRLVRS